MKLIISIILAVGVAIGLAMYATQDPGYVVLAREPYTIRLPLALFILFLLVAFAILYLLFNFIAGLFRAPKKVRKWNQGRQELGAQQMTMKGFASLIEGNWNDAEGNLLSRIEHNKASLMNYLGAAYAAQQQGLLERRNEHLEEALRTHPKQELAIKLTRARMQMQAGEWGDARDQLEFIRLSSPGNVAATRLLADSYRHLRDWPALVELLPAMSKLKAFPEQELRVREKQALSEHLEAPALLQGDGKKMEQAFKALPRKKKKDTAAVASYARQLVRSGEGQRAESVLRKALNRGWDADLIDVFGQCETRNVADQLKLLQHWGKENQNDPAYLTAMARLYRRDNQLEQAREYLSKAVATSGSAESVAELGDLLEQMGDTESARDTYRQGLKALAGSSALVAAEKVEGQLIALEQPVDQNGVLSESAEVEVLDSSVPVIADR